VNNNGSGTGGVIQLNGTPNPAAALGNATINVTGGNGYSLLIGSIINNAGAAGSTTFNPTTANLTIGSFSSSTAFAKTLVLDGTSDDNEVTGVIANGTAGTVALTKSNTSTWTLSSTNTYTGATTVNGGTLIFGASQTLSSLTIADGATVVLAEDLTPAPAPSGEEVVAFTALGAEAADLDGAASSFNGASHVSAVPEPGSLALLAFGALSLCRRRAGASRR
jgi:autotransporter-associated beta strand protein